MEEPDGLDENMHLTSQLADVDSSCTEAPEVNILESMFRKSRQILPSFRYNKFIRNA